MTLWISYKVGRICCSFVTVVHPGISLALCDKLDSVNKGVHDEIVSHWGKQGGLKEELLHLEITCVSQLQCSSL